MPKLTNSCPAQLKWSRAGACSTLGMPARRSGRDKLRKQFLGSHENSESLAAVIMSWGTDIAFSEVPDRREACDGDNAIGDTTRCTIATVSTTHRHH